MKFIGTMALAFFLLMANAQTNNNMNNNTLTKKQLRLAACANLEAQGDMHRLDKAIRNALDSGVTINELKEAFSQLYAYTGFPRSLNALNKLKTVLDDRKAKGITDNEGLKWEKPSLWDDAAKALKRGTEIQTRLGGGKAFNFDFCPQNDYYLKAHLFGDIFASGILSEADREIVTVAALSGMKGVESQLKAHKRGAVALGNSEEQVEELSQFLKEMNDKAQEVNWPQGDPNTAYAQYFTGNSYLAHISPKNLKEDGHTVQVYNNVTFEPGCRNNWHVHHGAHQILICVSGHGLYQEWGKPAIALQAGDIIDIPEGVKHWHGATSDSWFQHLTTHVATGGKQSNEWLEPVSDDEYEKANQPNN